VRREKKNGNGRSEIIDNSIVILIGLKPANATRVQLSKSWVNKAEMNFPIADSRFPPCLSWFLVLCLGAISSPCHPLLFFQVVQGGERAAVATATQRTHHHRIRGAPQNHQGA